MKRFLDSQFRIKDLGHLHYFLGLQVIREPNSVIITQRKFALDMLNDFGCDDLSPASAPLPAAIKLNTTDGALLTDPLMYRRLVVKLNFLTNTRPDISFAVQLLSQFIHAPRSSHYTAAVHVLRYIKGNLGQGLFMSNSPSFELQAFCDSDWAACPDSRRSVSGFIVMLGSSLLSWRSKK